MGPGPSDVSARVLNALARPTLGHLDPQFIELMDQTGDLLRYAFNTQNSLTMSISAPGSAGMEACIVNLIEPGDTVVVCINGVFGMRMKENVTRCGGTAIVIESEWGEQTSPEELENVLQANDNVKAVAFVHAETSTGVRNDAQRLCAIAKQHGCLTIVDAVTSLGGIELNIDEWQIDACYSGSQKCLSCVPGLSPVTFSETALEVIRNRQHPVQSWFLDLNLILGYWGAGTKRAYHHTAPVNSIYALHESLLMLQEEGLENAFTRHKKVHELLREGLESIGLTFAVDEAYRLPQLNVILIPEGADDATVRGRLLNEFGLEIGAGLGKFAGKAWRIGLMGSACTPRNVHHCVESLRHVLA
ncbi:pyridoxal-phosphate-dependent aminotransferase family protein [Alteromonas oceanisediminis]|uniref:pyridoxal-phosphate-dependent aminotransferase family protein n=1 Tax=Alteromonas oceanisediminis TaxID=2836180 RepID=UPI001BD92BCC|nr:alanine--glyoxylate aminotransferase family protein [Alteromonas oceanisediminis]MBT0587130.1 alanine--glyoxylate aminotransferase family protein [Alteromonas oceanisediminis]